MPDDDPPATMPVPVAGPVVGPVADPLAAGNAVAWRVDGRLRAVRLAGVLVFALATWAFLGDPVGTGLSGLAGLVCAGYGLRDLVAPVRLAADGTGVTVARGYAGRTRLDWARVRRLRVDRRSRLGSTSELLEIDTDDELYLFSAYDLGVPPARALAVLVALRTG